jgi:hypothetical protein
MKIPPIRVCCDTIPYRRGFVEVATVHSRCVSLETWDVSAEWAAPLTTLDVVPDDAVVGNTEIELTIEQARTLATALLAAADAASAGDAARDDDKPP